MTRRQRQTKCFVDEPHPATQPAESEGEMRVSRDDAERERQDEDPVWMEE